MRKATQPKIEKLLKSLAKKDNDFLSIFDSDFNIELDKRTQLRKDLILKHQEVQAFAKKNCCIVSVGLYSMIVSGEGFRYLAYYRKGRIFVENKQTNIQY